MTCHNCRCSRNGGYSHVTGLWHVGGLGAYASVSLSAHSFIELNVSSLSPLSSLYQVEYEYDDDRNRDSDSLSIYKLSPRFRNALTGTYIPSSAATCTPLHVPGCTGKLLISELVRLGTLQSLSEDPPSSLCGPT
jgi:hypothetical protein